MFAFLCYLVPLTVPRHKTPPWWKITQLRSLLLVRRSPAVNVLANRNAEQDKASWAQLGCDGSCGENCQSNCVSSLTGCREFLLFSPSLWDTGGFFFFYFFFMLLSIFVSFGCAGTWSRMLALWITCFQVLTVKYAKSQTQIITCGIPAFGGGDHQTVTSFGSCCCRQRRPTKVPLSCLIISSLTLTKRAAL